MYNNIRPNQSHSSLFGVPNLQNNPSRSSQINGTRTNTTAPAVSLPNPRQLSSADLRSSVPLPPVGTIEEPSYNSEQERWLRGQRSLLRFQHARRYENHNAVENQKQENVDFFAFLDPHSAKENEPKAYYCRPQASASLLHGGPAFPISLPPISQNQNMYDEQQQSGRHHHIYHQHVDQPRCDNAFDGSNTITRSTKLTNVMQENWINMCATGGSEHSYKNNGVSSFEQSHLLSHDLKQSFSSTGSYDKNNQQRQELVENGNHFSYFSNNEQRSSGNDQDTAAPRTWSKVAGDGHSSKAQNKSSCSYNHQHATNNTAVCLLLQEKFPPDLQPPLKPTRTANSTSNSVTPGATCSTLPLVKNNHAHDQHAENEVRKPSQQQRGSSTLNNDNNNDNSLDGKHTHPVIVKNNATKRLSDCLSYNVASINNPPATSKQYPVVMLSNIPWSITIREIETFLSLSPQENDRQYVHIMIDKSTGKTVREAFIEFDSERALEKTMKKFKGGSAVLKCYKVKLQLSSPEQVFRKIFPQWKGLFIDGKPAVLNNNACSELSSSEESTSEQLSLIVPPLIVERFEYESLLNICRNYKIRYSRKCLERPFENLMSMMTKFPWSTPEIITMMQRDHMYEYYKLATATLRFHMNKPNNRINNTLMLRMVRIALVCPGLTVNQKKGILTASQIPCPEDLAEYIETPSDE